MERRVVAWRTMIKEKKENLDPQKWMQKETVRGFADFILNKYSEQEADSSYDNKEMCEYATKALHNRSFHPFVQHLFI